MEEQQNIIIYRTVDGRASVALYAKDGKIWLNQQQMAELFATSKQAISYHIINILKEKELRKKFSCQRILDYCRRRQELQRCFLLPESPIRVRQ